MNLTILPKYIFLIWLPLANLEFISRRKFNDQRLYDETYSFPGHIEKKKEDVLETVEKEKEERPSIKDIFKYPKIASSHNRASENSPFEFSANQESKNNLYKKRGAITYFGKGKEPMKRDENEKSAQNLTYSVKKDLSALNRIYNVSIKNNQSAVAPLPVRGKRKRKKIGKREAKVETSKSGNANGNGNEENDRDHQDHLEEYDEEDLEEEQEELMGLGTHLGARCNDSCSEKLLHVYCDAESRICECEKKYPVEIGIGKGCAKPKQLGDQCFYAQTCSYYDANAICVQIHHNAICQCKPGFHTVSLQKGVKRMFCSEDLVVLNADLPTLLGVATGIAILTGLICFVLKLFSSNRYPHPRHYANANLAPPLLFSSDNQWINGIPLTVHGRPSSRSSSQRSTANLAHYPRSKGVLVPASRAGAARAAAILLIPCHLQATRTPETDVMNNSNNEDSDVVPENEIEQTSSHPGSRRPSVSSIHSTASSQKSYSARRFEQENQQREQRAAMRAAREEAARMAAPPTPSPMSTDELLPSCSKINENEPLGFTSSVLSVKSATSPRESSLPEFPTKISPCSSTVLTK